MTGISKRVFYGLAGALPMGMLNAMSGIRTILPYHHTVSDRELLHIKHLYPFKSVKQFTEDLDFLLKHYQPVSLQEMIAAEKMPATSRKNFLLTFDDGLRETAEVIAPILQSKGVPAIFFINPGFINNSKLFYRFKVSLLIEALTTKRLSGLTLQSARQLFGLNPSGELSTLLNRIRSVQREDEGRLDELAGLLELSFQDYLSHERPHLTTDQLRHLISNGFTIGAHSWDHPYYNRISLDEQLLQTRKSVQFVQSLTGESKVSFSFPHDDKPVSLDFFNHMASEEEIYPFFGIQNHKREAIRQVYHRFNAERPELTAEKQIKGILLLDFFRYIIGKQQVLRR